MADSPDTTRCSIGAISDATGIPKPTLRTWERRYGFPDPDRTEAGHRRYSPEVVDQLKLMARLIDAGHSPSEVVGLPQSRLHELLVQTDEAQQAEPDPGETDAPEMPSWLADWLEATNQLDGEALSRYFRSAWNRFGALEFLKNRAHPFLQQIGHAWARGELSAIHEHYISEQLRDFLSDQWRLLHDQSSGGPLVVCTTPEDEDHVLGLHIVSVIFGMAGWSILFLGSNTPIDDLIQTCRDGNIETVAISIAAAYDPDRARAYIDHLSKSIPPEIELVVGGAGAPTDLEDVHQFDSLDAFSEWAESQV